MSVRIFNGESEVSAIDPGNRGMNYGDGLFETMRDHLTELDQKVGDGDLGVNLARAAQAVLDHADALGAAPDVRTYFRAVSQLVRSETGGSSGALYSLLILGFADGFDEGVTSVDAAAAAPACPTWTPPC